MADLPEATLTIDDEAGAFAGSAGYCIVLSCVERNPDVTPRVFASAKALLDQHGYSAGADYVATHIDETGLPIIYVGLPTATDAVLARVNGTGVTGSCAISIAASAAGYLDEVDAILTVTKPGTIGTPGIVFTLSFDGGRTSKTIRLGSASSYTVPYFGIVITFGAGTLAVDDEYTFQTTAPMWDDTGLSAAFTALAAQMKLARSVMIIGDLPTHTFAGFVTTEMNDYETADDRYAYARVSIRDRLPLAAMSRAKKQMTGQPTLTFLEVGASGDTITRGSGSWIADGFAVGDVVTVAGSASNNVTGPIASLSATVLTFGTTDLANEGPVGNCTVVGSAGLTFAEVGATGDTITRTSGSWLDEGFAVGDVVTVAGTASNNVTGPIASLSTTVLTFGTTDLAAEVVRSDVVSITKGETMSAWVSAMDAEFDSVDAQRRIDLSLGRGRKLSKITDSMPRRPASWAASIREYQHDVQIPCWRKDDGPLDGWDLEDEDGNIVEYDDRTVGGALAARFTCFRTYSNGPRGAFIALSLTRAPEGSLLSRTHNMAVVDVACTVTQAETENAIGQVLVLDSGGHGTPASLALVESRVNTQLEIALLQQGSEGPRASSAVWQASKTDILNVPEATLNGTLLLELDGTLEKINTVVRIQTAGG